MEKGGAGAHPTMERPRPTPAGEVVSSHRTFKIRRGLSCNGSAVNGRKKSMNRISLAVFGQPGQIGGLEGGFKGFIRLYTVINQ